jgi:hypothetical protein
MADSHDEVRAAFARWAADQAGAPRDGQSLVQSVEPSYEYAGFLTTDIEGRRVAWKSVPFPGKARVTLPTIAVNEIDPWSFDAATLRERSDHIAVCGSCSGAGKGECDTCGGTGNVICGACRGQRKMYGYAANGSRRLLNCTSCKGKGQVDCAHCRRGIAPCRGCAGEGRLQQWIEPERWQRSVANQYPHALAQRFGWDGNAPNDVIGRDTDLLADLQQPRRLTEADLGNVPAQWLRQLAPTLAAGERVIRQRLRVARVNAFHVRYTLGSDEDLVTLTGRRLLAPPATTETAFARRASRLRSLRTLLLTVFAVIVVLSVARGPFYWSVPTALSILGFGAALAAVYGAASEATLHTTSTRRWVLGSIAAFVIAIVMLLVAMPRVEHIPRLLVQGKLAAAERELIALGDDAGAGAWADLRLAQTRGSQDVDEARKLAEKIPGRLPQHAEAARALDALILGKIAEHVRQQRWPDAAVALTLISAEGRKQADTAAAATAVYLPLADQKIMVTNYRGAADAVVAAKDFGVSETELDARAAAICKAATATVDAARKQSDAKARLRMRSAAEEELVSCERASGRWGTPALIALRTSMTRDVMTLEKAARQGRAP